MKRNEPLVPMFDLMLELSTILRKNRRKRGSIDFDVAETKIIVDENHKPVEIKPYDRNPATKIIEDFMLDIMYEIPKDDNIGRVTITGDYIRGTGGPLSDIRSNGYSLEERDQMKQIAAAETKEA